MLFKKNVILVAFVKDFNYCFFTLMGEMGENMK